MTLGDRMKMWGSTSQHILLLILLFGIFWTIPIKSEIKEMNSSFTYKMVTNNGPIGFEGTKRIANLGVNYGMVGDNLAEPEAVSEMLRQGTRVGSVKLYAPNAQVLRALARSGISVVVGVPDSDIAKLAASVAGASRWLATWIRPFYPATNIVALTVGNEILTSSQSAAAALLLPAMTNLRTALLFAGAPQIYVSTTHSMGVLASSFPPSAARFKQRLLPVLRPLLAFLASSRAPFMTNSYPYFAYKQDPDEISLDYALFRPNQGVTDANTGLIYSNLFDAQVDAIYYAMKAVGFDDIPVVVAESGWPSKGDDDEIGANLANAQEYNRNLIKHITSNVGTPAKPNTIIYTYIFALFNENEKPGPTSERNFGLLYPNMRPVYDIGFQLDGWGETRSSEGGSTWCIAKASTSLKDLQDILEYACGDGDADCRAIKEGGGCFFPKTLLAHASYAINSYFQLHGRNSWNCDFKGHAVLTTIDPSYGSCIYPTK